jgi:hypothetical protein
MPKRSDLEDLDDKRTALEAALAELVELAVPAKKLFDQQVIDRWVKRLEANGFSALTARTLVELSPTLGRYFRKHLVQ